MSLALEADPAVAALSRRSSARPSVVLPEPLSPTTPTVSPSAHRDVDAVHRLDVADGAAQQAALDREPDLDVLGRHDDRGVGRAARGGPALGLGGQQVSGVGVLRALEDLARRGPASTISPSVITHTRSAILRTMPRSWVISSIAMPSSRLQIAQQRQDLRLDGDVERGRRLVGDQQVGLVGERHGDHHALALAAGELVRIGAEALARRPAGRPGPAAPGARARAWPGVMPRCSMQHSRRSAARCVQRIERGHRLLEDHADPGRRAPRGASRSAAPSSSCARRSGCCRPGAGPWDRAAAAGSTAP